MASGDAAALGILPDKDYFKGGVEDSLVVYEKVCLPCATKIEFSAAQAVYNINERTGFSSNTSFSNYKVDKAKELAVEEIRTYGMYKHIDQAFSE